MTARRQHGAATVPPKGRGKELGPRERPDYHRPHVLRCPFMSEAPGPKKPRSLAQLRGREAPCTGTTAVRERRALRAGSTSPSSPRSAFPATLPGPGAYIAAKYPVFFKRGEALLERKLGTKWQKGLCKPPLPAPKAVVACPGRAPQEGQAPLGLPQARPHCPERSSPR